LNPLDDAVQVCAAQIEDTDDPQGVLQHLGLVNVPRETIENQCVQIGIESAAPCLAFDGLTPKVHSGFVGNQLSAARILDKHPSDLAFNREVSKDVATGAMEEVWDGPEDFSLCAFAGARGAEQQDSAVFHLAGDR
jgi:hypothetical protein